MSSYTPFSPESSTAPPELVKIRPTWLALNRQAWLIFAVAIFLVAVPVFFQAPLVRLLPWVSLCLSVGWFGLSGWLLTRHSTRLWGDLLLGFSWTWLAGSIYWGWLRWEPYWHLPVEAIALPIVVYCLWRQWGKVGSWFYLGSLLGTAITDLYFYLVDLIPQWRQLMQVDSTLAMPIFQSALIKMQTLWGVSWAYVLANGLVAVGVAALRSQELHWWAFGGAVLSTLLVDGLFWLVAVSV